jgi:HAD superfamily hydrolase (TIGR01458 family)
MTARRSMDPAGLLVDVDGTLLVDDRAIPGVPEALERIRSAGLPLRLTTNTTRRPRSAVAAVLRREGYRLEDEEVLVPSILARRRILDSGRPRAGLMVAEATREDFEGVESVEEGPDWVVLGDLGEGFDYARLNRAFGWLQGGAGFLALQKNRAWKPDGRELALDAGPFVAALEYAAGVEAEVVGKPSRAFFDLALEELGLGPGAVLVVGDDAETDARGGAAAGCLTAVVRTGKFSEEALRRAGLEPDLLLDSIASLPERLGL